MDRRFILSVTLLFYLALFKGCREYTDEPFADLPAVLTLSPGSVMISTIEMSGEVTDDSGLKVTANGFCWSSSNQNPTTDDSITIAGGEGTFSGIIRNLSGKTKYYIRAFATTRKGTGYGAVIPVETADTVVTDIDNNKYNVVQIANRMWMAENLRVTRYNNGDSIPKVTESLSWKNLSYGAYCWYGNDEAANRKTYGALYNWFVLSGERHIAPQGWHVASVFDWKFLTDSLGGGSVAGGKLKETGTAHWNNPNSGATNEFDFSALPGGYRHSADGIFKNKGTIACWWSVLPDSGSTAFYTRIYNFSTLLELENNFKTNGFSVRCVRD